MNESMNILSAKQCQALLAVLSARFRQHMERHTGADWAGVAARLAAQPDKLWSLSHMESTGGEPDVVAMDENTGEYVFYDCAAETPKGRRSLCYDAAALQSRKENKPGDSAINMASAMGVHILTETAYRSLQQLGQFDTKTSSWIETPGNIRELGGALFADRRYNSVFVYHNGAESYYAARGFRASLTV